LIETLQLIKQKNVGLLPRDLVYATAQAGIISHNFQTTNLHASGIGLDISVYNTDTLDHNIYLDGIPFIVKAGSTLSLSDTPFINFFTDSSTNTWVVRLLGVSLEVLRS
jgi:hypothetical protein